jgi:hypothetical protein
MSRRRSLLPAAALLALCLAAPAPAGAIVNGSRAEQGEYPAQGVLLVYSSGGAAPDLVCGGTLVGSRQFLTAARCTTDDLDRELPVGTLRVRLGNVDRSPALPDEYTVVDNDVADDPVEYSGSPPRHDIAMLTLNRVANYEVMRVVDRSETALWAPDTSARVLGWGYIETAGPDQKFLREVDIPIIPDDRCASAYPAFEPSVMVCAADPLGTPALEARDSCFEDWGGPLLVPDAESYALAGIVSWRGADCGNPQRPGVYTRVGADPLNTWVHERIPEANFGFSHTPLANQPVTLTSTSRHPPPGLEGDDYFDTFRWDLNRDRVFDRLGKSVTLTFQQGRQVVGLEASKAGGDKATAYFAFNVGADPNAPPPPQPNLTPATATPKRAGFLATIHAAKRPKVRRGRFNIRVSFARTAPAGIAVVEAIRGKRKIGIARKRVRRGGTRLISVKLTPTGRRLLARSATKRLKLRVRVRVGKRILRSKGLTVRR